MTAPKAPKVVRAERFEVVDAEGRVRARIGPRTRRNSNGTNRSIDLELFGADGAVYASVTVDNDGDARVYVGPRHGGSHIRLWRAAAVEEHFIPERAAVNVAGGTGCWYNVEVDDGAFPREFHAGPDLLYGVPFISDRRSLGYATERAQRTVKESRNEATAVRSTDKNEYRRLMREANRIEKTIEKATAAFEEREEATRARWRS